MQLNANLEHHEPPSALSARGLMRAATATVTVLIGLSVYVAIVVFVSVRLRLDGTAAYWMAAGLLCLLLAAVGWARLLRVRSLVLLSDRAITLYVVAAGIVMLVFGARREVAFERAKRRCLAALANAENIHQRMRVLYGTRASLPTMGDDGSPSTLTCERLVHE